MFSKIAVIGHRGVGKSYFVERNKSLFSNSFDLDAQIEARSGQSIAKIFAEKGESGFRQLELETFQKICVEGGHSEFLISVGAGFPVDKIPADIFVLYLQKSSDQEGRIFLNRPRLNPELSALQEFQQRYLQRNPKFLHHADWVWDLPEGDPAWSPGYLEMERNFLQSLKQGASFECKHIWSTLQAWHFQRPFRLRTLSLLQNVTWEIRDDLLEFADLNVFLTLKKPFLFSFRDKESQLWAMAALESSCIGFDWDVSLGDVPEDLQNRPGLKIISSHSLMPPSEKEGLQLKWAPIVKDWSQLSEGVQWSDFESKFFLPRSEDGKWNWYRQVSLAKSKTVQFVSLGIPSSADQPAFFQSQWLPASGDQGFAAVLGSPVRHSWSPLFHQRFSSDQGRFFLFIQVDRGEWAESFPLLQALGLRQVAITSPLKMEAAEYFHLKEPINTLRLDEGKVQACVTDFDGFQKALSSIQPDWSSRKFIIWGSGALSEGLKSILGDAMVVSAREGLTDSQKASLTGTYVLIWASPDATSGFPMDLPVESVLDLNYKENSLGKDIANQMKVPYFSGAEFFIQQAKLQQEFWR